MASCAIKVDIIIIHHQRQQQQQLLAAVSIAVREMAALTSCTFPSYLLTPVGIACGELVVWFRMEGLLCFC